MRFKDEYAFMSNMTRLLIPIKHKGIRYYSTENFYQAMKTKDRYERLKISEMKPNESKKYARTLELRDDWDDIKIKVMKKAIKHKFSIPTFAARLMEVEGEIVEDNYWGDVFWGVCDGVGENHLGKLLMKKRAKLLKG